MTSAPSAQEIFESFLRGEISQSEAADALIAAIVAQKAGGVPVRLQLAKPAGVVLSATDHERADGLLAEIDRRASASDD